MDKIITSNDCFCWILQMEAELERILKENRDLLTVARRPKTCHENLRMSGLGENVSVQLLMADSSYWEGEFSRALEEYQAALASQPGETDNQLCHLGQARCHARLFYFNEAERLLGKLYQRADRLLNDKTPTPALLAACELSLLYAGQKKIPEARIMFHTSLVPESFQNSFHRGMIYKTRGIVRYLASSWDGSTADLVQSAQLLDGHLEALEVWFFLGRIAQKLGESTEASKWYQRLAAASQTFAGKEADAELSWLPCLPPSSTPVQETQKMLTIPTEEGEKNMEEPKEPIPVEVDAAKYEEIWLHMPLSAVLVGLDMLETQPRKDKG
jgi:tetratricopeptide (TPR) repeat protein